MDHYIFLVALAVIILNVAAALGGSKRRERLSREFEIYPMPIKFDGGVVVVALIILTVIAVNYFGAASASLPR